MGPVLVNPISIPYRWSSTRLGNSIFWWGVHQRNWCQATKWWPTKSVISQTFSGANYLWYGKLVTTSWIRISHFNRLFHCKPSSYGGFPISGNLHMLIAQILVLGCESKYYHVFHICFLCFHKAGNVHRLAPPSWKTDPTSSGSLSEPHNYVHVCTWRMYKEIDTDR